MAATDAFAPACIELFSRVWLDLEAALEAGSSLEWTDEDMLFWQVLRLELHVVLDQCRGESSRIPLIKPQRKLLRKTILEVLQYLDAIDASSPAREVIERAQNVLFDAIDTLLGSETGSTVPIPLRRAAS